MPIQVRPDGPIPARVMIVGEAPGAEEEAKGVPFCGASGMELNRMLHEAGISRSECFVTNVARERPSGNDINSFVAQKVKERTPAHTLFRGKWVKKPIIEGCALLEREIAMVKPNIILALGGTSLWALTGLNGIMKWRGSMLYTKDMGVETKLIPTIHPAAILRAWDLRHIAVHDIRRAARFRNGESYPETNWNFELRPSFTTVMQRLIDLTIAAGTSDTPLDLSVDIETRGGHIACIGLAWTVRDAICIPFMCVENKDGYWSEEEEATIVYRLQLLLTHPNIRNIGQNYLYDTQYFYRHWHFLPHGVNDTMIDHHVCFLGLKKSLAFQASMYCDQYVYWKDDGKEWNVRGMGEEALWSYNDEDCVRTLECARVEAKVVKQLGLEEQVAFQQSMFWPILQAMIRGVRIDTKVRDQFALELFDEMSKREQFFRDLLGHNLNPRSPPQMQRLFYDDLKLPVIIKRGTGKPTLDDDALTRLGTREPLIRPLLKAIAEYRSLGVFLSTFVGAPLDIDGRMRCSYNICGAETLRLSSSENAFGSGANLQTIPKGSKGKEAEDLELPNVRKMFIPDPGHTFFDLDLDRADLQVVVWEANDEDLKLALRLGIDMHLMNATAIFNIKGIPADELVETHPNYLEHRARIGESKRQIAKTGVHAVDYYCQARTLAIHLGSTVREAEQFITGWFGAHPGIKRWHERTEASLKSTRTVTNRFGYRRFYFDRIDSVLPEALAWQGQSTVAITINKIWKRFHDDLPECSVLLQVHDSLAGQIRSSAVPRVVPQMRELSRIVIPYEDPLIIPVGIKVSEKSWGDCK